jgi:hypothetical protein
MAYTLIDGKGKVMTFYVRAVAELYRNLQGGVVISNDILEDTTYGSEYMVQS